MDADLEFMRATFRGAQFVRLWQDKCGKASRGGEPVPGSAPGTGSPVGTG